MLNTSSSDDTEWCHSYWSALLQVMTAMKYVVIKSSSGPVLAHNECDIGTMVTFEYLIRRLIVRSREVSKPRDW